MAVPRPSGRAPFRYPACRAPAAGARRLATPCVPRDANGVPEEARRVASSDLRCRLAAADWKQGSLHRTAQGSPQDLVGYAGFLPCDQICRFERRAQRLPLDELEHGAGLETMTQETLDLFE